MHVDADSLEQLNLRTRDGAERAGRTLTELIDAETQIGTTRITLVSQQDLAGEVGALDAECVEFDLTGPLSGRVLLAFDDGIREQIRAVDSEADSVERAGTDLVGAFAAEWETDVDSTLTVGKPRYIGEPGGHDFGLEAVTADTESTPVFRTSVSVADPDGLVTLYFAPDGKSMETLLSVGMEDSASGNDDGGSLFDDEDESASIPLEKLSVFSDLTREGTSAAADRVTAMTGIETATEISGVTFTPIDDISGQLADGDYVGTTAEFGGTPSGAVVVLYRESTAEQLAEAMLPMEPDGDGITDMHESALAELGNIIISGFIDGWANVLQTSVEHTPPEFEDDMEMRMLELVTDQLGPFQTHAYTIESHIETDELAFDCEIHALPDEAKLGEALESLLVDRREQVEADPDDIF